MPTAPTTLAVYQADLQPLQGRWARAWGTALGASKDATVERARQAVLVGAITRAPDDALPLLGADVALEQYPDETADDYRVRIAGAWDTWPWAGTRTALETVATQLDFHGVYILTAREWGMSDAATLWARWWLLVTQGDPFAPDDAWDDAGTYDDGGTWDSDASLASIATIRRAFRRFANARDRGFVRFNFDETVDYYGDGGVWDGGDITPALAAVDIWGDEPAFLEVEI